MKKFFAIAFVVSALMLTGYNKVVAQQKIGWIDMMELINAMPEKKKADTLLEQYRSALIKDAEDEATDLQSKFDKFIKDSATMSEAVKTVQRTKLQELYSKSQGKEEEIQQKLRAKSDELSAPIQKKAMDAIKLVAKEGGYVYILPKEVLYVSPDADNILEAVKKKLGLK